MSLPTWNGSNKCKGPSKARKAAAAAAAAGSSTSSSSVSFVPADGYVRVPQNETPSMTFKGYCAIANLEVRNTAAHTAQRCESNAEQREATHSDNGEKRDCHRARDWHGAQGAQRRTALACTLL